MKQNNYLNYKYQKLKTKLKQFQEYQDYLNVRKMQKINTLMQDEDELISEFDDLEEQ